MHRFRIFGSSGPRSRAFPCFTEVQPLSRVIINLLRGPSDTGVRGGIYSTSTESRSFKCPGWLWRRLWSDEYDRPYLSHEAEGSTFERLEGWRGTDYPFAVIVLARNFHHWRRLPRVAACAGTPATTCASTLSLTASRAWPIPSPPKRILRMPTLNSGIYSASA